MKILFSILSFLLATSALAASVFDEAKTTLGNTNVSANTIVTAQSLPERIGTVIGVLLSIIGVLLLVNIIYAGFQWVISKGATDKIKTARNTIIYSVMGLVIVISAYAISKFIIDALYAQPAT